MAKIRFKIMMLKIKIYIKILSLLRKIGIKIPITNKEKEYMISMALQTDEGREALADAMLGGIDGKE